MTGRLTLSWMGKDKTLFSTSAGGYEWVQRDDPRMTEVRLLHETASVGANEGGDNTPDNLVISGDCYYALNSLMRIPEYAEQYHGKVKLIYIDPPFIPDRTVMGIMGWSSTAMAARYQHIIAAIRRDVATSVGCLLWKPVEGPTENAPELTDEQREAIRLLLTTLPEPYRERLIDLFDDQGDGMIAPAA